MWLGDQTGSLHINIGKEILLVHLNILYCNGLQNVVDSLAQNKSGSE